MMEEKWICNDVSHCFPWTWVKNQDREITYLNMDFKREEKLIFILKLNEMYLILRNSL